MTMSLLLLKNKESNTFIKYVKVDSLMAYLDGLEKDVASKEQLAVVKEIKRWLRIKFYLEDRQ